MAIKERERRRLRVKANFRNHPREKKAPIHVPQTDSLEDEREVEIEQKKLFLAGLDKAMGVVLQACRKTGIDRQVYNRWMREDSEFAAYIEDIIEPNAVDIVESKMLAKILDKDNPDKSFIQFYLTRRGHKRGYGDKLAVTGSDDDLAEDVELPEEARRITTRRPREFSVNGRPKGSRRPRF